jgi:hypothetical protein
LSAGYDLVKFPYTGATHIDLLKATAFHEAGHATVAFRFGKYLRERGLSIDTASPGNGHAHIRGEIPIPDELNSDLPPALRRAQEKRLRSECMELLAGYAAEFRGMRVRGFPLIDSSDVRTAMARIQFARGCDENHAQYELQLYRLDVRALIQRPAMWSAISTLAGELLRARDGKLAAGEAEAVLKRAGLRPVRRTYWVK